MAEHEPLPNSDAAAAEQPLSILCVDDEAYILTSLTRLFRGEPYGVLTATSGEEGLAILKDAGNVGLILSDYRMPVMNGTAFLKAASELVPDSYRMILTGYADMNAAVEAINLGGASRFLTKPVNSQELLQAVRDGLERVRLSRDNQRLTALVRRQYEELAEWNANLKKRVLQQTSQLRTQLELQEKRNRKVHDAVVTSFSDLLEQRRGRANRHVRTVADLADRIAQSLGVSYHLRKAIREAALLHDVGAIGLPDRLLAKPREQMNPEELRTYQDHAARGEELIGQIEGLQEVGVLIRHHHEAYNGSGYPDGLAGEQIPLGARIIAVADWIENTYAGVTTPDVKYQVTRKLGNEMGRLFDPALTIPANRAVMEVLPDPPQFKDMSEEQLPLAELCPGMILSRNVYSDTGVLLLERGVQLDDAEIAGLRRHLRKNHNLHLFRRSIGAARPS